MARAMHPLRTFEPPHQPGSVLVCPACRLAAAIILSDRASWSCTACLAHGPAHGGGKGFPDAPFVPGRSRPEQPGNLG